MLTTLRHWVSRRRNQRQVDGILKVAALFQAPHFSYTTYQEAVELLQVVVPDRVTVALKKFDRVLWSEMTLDAKLFIYQSCMSLLPSPL